MQAFVSNFTRRRSQRSLSPAFRHAFAHEVLKTERLRIIALIVVATVVTVSLGVVDFIAPDVLNRIWRGHFPVLFLATHERDVHEECCRLLGSWRYEIEVVGDQSSDRAELLAKPHESL